MSKRYKRDNVSSQWAFEPTNWKHADASKQWKLKQGFMFIMQKHTTFQEHSTSSMYVAITMSRAFNIFQVYQYFTIYRQWNVYLI